jgi:hypothetical protein
MKPRILIKRFLKNWRLARCYGSSRRVALRIALRSLRRDRDFGITDEDWVDAYRHKSVVVDQEGN